MGVPMLAGGAQALPALGEGQKQRVEPIGEEIVKKQQPDGSWEFFATLRRPPINESQTTDVAWTVLALRELTAADAPKARREALAQGRSRLDGPRRADTHQEKVLRLILGARGGQPPKALQPLV